MNPPHASEQVDLLLALMRLESAGEDRFLAQSDDIGTPAVFGGQVLGQALMAACRTAPADRQVHSLHAYFLLPGEHAPIDYEVTRVRDGRSFSMRRVVARQQGETIFELTASFQTADQGVEHQVAMPEVPGPEGLVSDHALRQAILPQLPAFLREKNMAPRGLEIRRVEPDDLLNPTPRPARTALWVRAMAPLPDDPLIHRALLAYGSDHGLLLAAIAPHGLSLFRGDVRMASLDHAMWFHRDFRLDDWLLYVIDSPSAGGARGLCEGRFYSRDGRLVASVAQEGMVRLRAPRPVA
ncbi:MAG TPA: acyl-CoA thioesterase II [Aquabacterium sp.]|nr:acyl-CoA thioesterase II [Aquabacterium sp.]